MQKTQDGLEEKQYQQPEAKAAQVEDPEASYDLHFESPAGMEIDPEDLRPRPWIFPERKRVLISAGIVLALVLAAVLPPLISANRFRRRIAQSVSESLGRPVHMDAVALTVFPMPGFTLENFVVTEDPAFGSEPVIQARNVRVTLRVWSLWRRRVEFSRITLEDPSVNLVHRADGHWNIESILLQAAKIEAAPTAQTGASDAPRFPYIEASGARINVMMGLEKKPLALTEADLALWLPQPSQWRLRLEGRPTRTDTAPTDTGLVRIQGTLGKAATIEAVPVDLTGEWRTAPLGGVSYVLTGRDAGFRGDMTLRASVRGTIGENALTSRLELSDLRRADFVPRRTLDIDISCNAQTAQVLHRFNQVRCGWPAEVLDNGAASGLALQGELADALQPQKATADATLRSVPVSNLLDALRLMSARVSPELKAGGTISGTLAMGAGGWSSAAGPLAIAKARLAVGEGKPFLDGEVSGEAANGALVMRPVALDLGGTLPAEVEARVDANGYALHLSGTVLRSRLMELAAALPQFGDGLEEALPPKLTEAIALETPIRVDLVSSRSWTGGQTWTAAAVKATKGKRGSGRR